VIQYTSDQVGLYVKHEGIVAIERQSTIAYWSRLSSLCEQCAFCTWINYFQAEFNSGPSVAVNTMCSSSLLALQMACQSIRNGDCHWALVGVAHLVLTPQTSLQLQRLSMISPDGACKSFDASGNG